MSTRRRRFYWLVGLVLATPVLYAAVSAYFAYYFTTPPRRAVGALDADQRAAIETVRFPATDGVQLAGWFLPRAGTTRAVVLLHGNGSTRRQMLARAKFLHHHGYGVLLYDARGHGESAGTLVSVGWYEKRDLLGALDYLRARGFREFGLIGASQGAATVALSASELRDVRWVALESMYPTLHDAIDCRFRRTLWMPGWLGGLFMVPFAEWRLGISAEAVAPIDHVAKLPCPVFILHGERDAHTFSTSARAVFARAREPKSLWIVPGAAHVDLYGFAKGEYEQRLLAFIQRSTATGAAVTAASNPQ